MRPLRNHERPTRPNAGRFVAIFRKSNEAGVSEAISVLDDGLKVAVWPIVTHH